MVGDLTAGGPVDRYYIESFLEHHWYDVHGQVLEILNSDYADKFGLAVERVDILDIDPTNRQATVIADLAAADSIRDELVRLFHPDTNTAADLRCEIRHCSRASDPSPGRRITCDYSGS